MTNCIFCSSTTIPLESSFDSIRLQYPSSISKSPINSIFNTHSFHPSICSSCGLPQFSSDTFYPLLGFFDTSNIFNEPNFHFSQIYDFFSSQTSTSISNIVASSSKDSALFDYLFQKLPNLRAHVGQRLFLFTRFLEHIASYSALTCLLDQVQINDLIYIEVLDFACQDSPLYIWDERIAYPSSDYLIAFFNSMGYQLEWKKHFSSSEPFISFVFQKLNQQNPSSYFIAPTNIDLSIQLNHIFDVIRSFLTQYQSIAFYGIGHKSLTIAGLLLSLNPDIQLKFLDSSPSKVGRYWSAISIEPIDDNNLPISQVHLLAFGGSAFDMLKEKILALHPHSKVLSLHGLFKYYSNC